MKATAANYLKLDRLYGLDSTDEQSEYLQALYKAMPQNEKRKLESIWFAQQEEYYNNYRTAVPLPAPKSTRTLGFYRASARFMFKF